MPLQKLVKLALVAAVLASPAARAGADDYGIAGLAHPVRTRGAGGEGGAHLPGGSAPQSAPRGADDYGIA